MQVQTLREKTLAAAMLAMLLMVPVADAQAASYTVCNSGCNYSTIAAALAAVSNNAANSITVKSPYSANEAITVSKAGAGVGSELVIQGDGSYPITKGFVVDTNYVIIKGFTATGSSRQYGSIDVEGNYVQILNNFVSNNTNANGTEIGVDANGNSSSAASYVTISGNTISNTVGFTDDYPLISMVCQYCTVSNNDISGESVDGIHPWGHDITISNNYFHDFVLNSGSGAHMDMVQVYGDCGSSFCKNSYNVNFISNVAFNITHDLCNISNDSQSGIHDWSFRNNVIFYTYAQANIGVPNTRFENNTFIDNSYYNQNMVLNVMGVGGGWDDTGLVIKNNIFVTAFNQPPFVPDSNTTHSNNYTASHSGSTYSAIKGWSETNGVNGGDPSFASYSGTDSVSLLPASTVYAGSDTKGTNDFRPQSTSILAGKGVNLYSEFATDALGNVRPSSGSWDIGAYSCSTIALSPPTGLHLVAPTN